MNKTCYCKEPTPKGMWGVDDGISKAQCQCGGWYATELLRKANLLDKKSINQKKV